MEGKAVESVLKLDHIAFENIRKLHLEFFEAYFRKTKDRPIFESNEAVTITEYKPDR